MNEYEKDIIKLLELYKKAEKRSLNKILNTVIRNGGIKRNGKNRWVCKVTGSPHGTVCTWFSNTSCKYQYKISLYAICKIAVALEISIWDIFKDVSIINEKKGTEIDRRDKQGTEIDRRDKLYWHLRRKEAAKIWESRCGTYGIWEEQSKDVQREFLDMLYLERRKEQEIL